MGDPWTWWRQQRKSLLSDWDEGRIDYREYQIRRRELFERFVRWVEIYETTPCRCCGTDTIAKDSHTGEPLCEECGGYNPELENLKV